MRDTTAEWLSVTKYMTKKGRKIDLGHYASYWLYQTPRRMLHCLSYYKFASKMIGRGKRVFDVGCNEGLGTYILAKENGFAKGIDFDKKTIIKAKKNFSEECIQFEIGDFFSTSGQEEWDAVVSFDVIEDISPDKAPKFLEKICSHLTPSGLAIIGTPSQISQTFASTGSKQGHINIYSHENFEKEMREYFDFVFLFAANDEVVHTGYLPLAHYFIAIGCKKK